MALIDVKDLRRLRYNLQVLYVEFGKRNKRSLPNQIVWHDERLDLAWIKKDEDPDCPAPHVIIIYKLPIELAKNIFVEIDGETYGTLQGLRIFL